MKLALTLILALTSSIAIAGVNEFNKTLIEGVQKDIQTDNDHALKVNNAPMRGPASVKEEPHTQPMKQDLKIDKKERQFGNTKW